MTKPDLRTSITTRLQTVTEEQRQRWSVAATAHLAATAHWGRAIQILAFQSLPSEIDTTELIDHALTAGKTVYLPRTDGQMLSFHRWEPNDPMIRHRYGMLEPSADAPRWQPHDSPPASTLVVCPGLAFDHSGRRLGRGGGFYDRFLAAHRAAVLVVGFCYGLQVVPRVPVNQTDELVQMIATEHGVVESTTHNR